MAYYPQSGDIEGWFAWFREHNPGCTEEQVVAGVLPIFEADVWCQRSRVRALRLQIERNSTVLPEFVAETEKLQRTLEFLTQDTPQHRSHVFKQYREKLRHGRWKYAMFNSIPPDEPYGEIEMEIVRSRG
jgi:hypothetical protein